MHKGQIYVAAFFFAMLLFAWGFYFRRDLNRWWVERGPRRRLAQEAAREREAELARLREELAGKYLRPGVGRQPPATDR
jgi:hypothetical protein